MSSDKALYAATHEAGHAVVGLLLGKPLDVVTIEPDVNTGHAITDHGGNRYRVATLNNQGPLSRPLNCLPCTNAGG